MQRGLLTIVAPHLLRHTFATLWLKIHLHESKLRRVGCKHALAPLPWNYLNRPKPSLASILKSAPPYFAALETDLPLVIPLLKFAPQSQ